MSGALPSDVLPAAQQDVLRRIGPLVTARGFYLAGGTALALQLGHRHSVDFDWFRTPPIGDPLALAAELGVEVVSTAKDTLHAVADDVQLSFFSYAYPLLGALVDAPEFRCSLAALPDIAAMKLAAICQRGARKDYHDLLALGRAGLGLPEMLAAYRRKFSVRDEAHVLVALTWFDDADRDPEPVLAAATSWDEVKSALRAQVKAYAGR